MTMTSTCSTVLNKENNESILVTSAGIFLQKSDNPHSTPEKIIDVRGGNFYINRKPNDIVKAFGRRDLLSIHTMALKTIFANTDKKHIYVTTPIGAYIRINIMKLLNSGKLMYFRNFGKTKVAYCTIESLYEMEE